MKTKNSTKQDVKYTLQCITKGNIKMKNENKTLTLTLTVEELDLIRHATWSLDYFYTIKRNRKRYGRKEL